MTLWRDMPIDDDKIEKLRKKIYDYLATNPDDVIPEDVMNRIPSSSSSTSKSNDNTNTISDINSNVIVDNNNDLNNNNPEESNGGGGGVKCKDWMLKRFLIAAHMDVEEAFKRFKTFFGFRKTFNLPEMTMENSIPKEFFQLRAIDRVGKDKQDNKLLTIRLKYYRKIPQLETVVKRCLIYYFEQLDLEYENGLIDGICLIIDVQQFPITHVDLDMLNFLVYHTLSNYIGLAQNVLVYELPMLLSYLTKIVEGWLPTITDKNGKKQKMFAVISKKNIDQFINEEDRPEYLNGKLKFTEQQLIIPKDSQPFEIYVKYLNLKEQNIQKIKKHLQDTFKENNIPMD